MASDVLFKLDCTVRETRMKFYMTFREPKLYRYAKSFQFDKIIERCQRHPRAAAREARFQHDYAPAQTPLHVVLEPLFLLGQTMAAGEEMVEQRHLAAAALLKANPEAALVPCILGTTPLVMVCVDPYASLKDVEMLLKVGPRSALVADLEGRRPLHYACVNNRNNESMIKQLLESSQEACAVQDKLGRMPLHYASMASPTHCKDVGGALALQFEGAVVEQSNKAPISTVSVLKLLINAHKESVSAVDKEGRTPLWYLCQYLESLDDDDDDAGTAADILAMIHLLVNTNPKVASMSGRDDNVTPLSILQNYHQQLEARLINSTEESSSKQRQRSNYKLLGDIIDLCR